MASKLERWLSQQRPEIRKNAKVIKAVPLHISITPVRVFAPMIGTRQLKEEDRTIPRVCCGVSLMDCIYGHSAVVSQIVYDWAINAKGDDVDSKSKVFYVYDLGETECIKPNKRLVIGADRSNEVWVVGYRPETLSIKPKTLARFTIVNRTETFELNKHSSTTTFIVNADEPILLDEGVMVEAGCYKFVAEGDFFDHDSGSDAPAPPRTKIQAPVKVSLSEWQRVSKAMK